MQFKLINSKNKKAQMLNQEFALVVVSLVLIGIILFLSFKYVGASRNDFEKLSPEITYQYPTIYVHTFLLTEVILTQDDVSKIKDESGINLVKNKKYKIKDLLELVTDKSYVLEQLINDYKTEYRDRTKSTLLNYNKFSNEFIANSETLIIDYNKKVIPNLENELCNKNYFFYFKNSQNDFVVVYFKSAALTDNVCKYGVEKRQEYLPGEGLKTEQETIGQEGA